MAIARTIPLWRQIQKLNFTKIGPLLEFLELDASTQSQILSFPRFPLNVPFRIAKKMEKNNPKDPLFRQFIPMQEELLESPGYVSDPVQDLCFQSKAKLLHKYHGRALLLATSACAMNCRFCFRQNFPYETEIKHFDEEMQYIREHKDLSEIILSGGDPLSLSDETLFQLFDSLNAIEHVKRVRFHTRFPIGIPERIDDSFLQVLHSSSKQIYFILHVNHPNELDEEIFLSLNQLKEKSIPILTQSVLLKGVNDEENTLFSLFEMLVNKGIIPYYLHLLDPVQGTAHFQVEEPRAQALVRFLQSHLSGFAVPRLVREIPNALSKTFITH